MLRPAVSQMLTKNESYYSLVLAVAKRAREIADINVENKQPMEEKPVKLAIEDFASGQYRIVEDPSVAKK